MKKISLNLENKNVIITGGNGFLGSQITEALLNERSNVYIIDVKKPKKRTLAKQFKSDITNEVELKKVLNFFKSKNIKIDVLINNAGTNPSGGYLMDVEISRVQKTWDVNLLGPLLWTRAAVKAGLTESVINVASVGGIKPATYMGAYNISKAGLIYMTKQLAKELAPNIRVNGIAPAVVKTKLSEMLWENDEQATADLHALKKLGTPEDISNLMYFLSSEEASWITGEVVTIDGGYLL